MKYRFPEGIRHAYNFGIFNALSYQIVLGSPMVLYGKSLGASATVLGIIAGMMPLLVIFQIPAANHVARVGYKRFVYAGWGTRVAFIFAMAAVPLAGVFLERSSQLALLLFLLFGFNLSRGISSCAWLPWITTLVPESLRGRFLAREAVWVNAASVAALLFAAACLGSNPASWQFAIVFGFSAAMGAVSLKHLKAIPDAAPPEDPARNNATPVPWLDIAGHPPFRKLLIFNVAWAVAYGGMNTFSVAFLKSEAQLTEGRILLLTALSFLGGLSGLWLFESKTDRFGSKPVVSGALGVWIMVAGVWTLLAGQTVPASVAIVAALQVAMGFAFALVNMNNTRLAMVLAPPMGRSHFFALFSVVFNVTLGLAPIGWGLLIDAMGHISTGNSVFAVNRYSVFFALVLVSFAAALVLCRNIEEPKARPLDELLRETLLQSKLRYWLRLWPRW